MSSDDPKRLSEIAGSSDDADSFLRDALRASKRDLPEESRLAAIALKLGPLVGGAAGGGGAAAATGAGAAKASVAPAAAKIAGLSASMKLAAIVAVTGVAVGGGIAIVPRMIAPRAAVSMAPTTSATTFALPTTSAPSWSLPPASASAQALPVPTLPRTPTTATTTKPQDPDEEMRAIERAQDVLATDPHAALTICNDDLARSPRGSLAQEREVIAIDALTRLGRMPEAEVRAKKFAHDYPGSAQLPRVQKLVGEN